MFNLFKDFKNGFCDGFIFQAKYIFNQFKKFWVIESPSAKGFKEAQKRLEIEKAFEAGLKAGLK